MNKKRCIPEKSLILIDDSNLYYGCIKYDWEIDYQKFYDWLHDTFNIYEIYFFGGIITQKAYLDSHPNKEFLDFVNEQDKRKNFFKKLKKIGYKVKSKPVVSLYDSTKGDYKRKCNFDVEITINAIDNLNSYKELILCSGDGDFIKLLK